MAMGLVFMKRKESAKKGNNGRLGATDGQERDGQTAERQTV